MPYECYSVETRQKLRETFDHVAQLYDENRPSYPVEVFDEVIRISGVTAQSRLLEIGCGTGHATEVFAARGMRIDAIELGEHMAGLARRRLGAYPHITIEVTDFDHWTSAARYHLIYAATAWHWLEPATREQKIAALLCPSGWLAMWRNRHIRNGSCDDFLDAAQPVYLRIAPELVLQRAQLPGPENVLEVERERLASGLFEEPITYTCFWRKRYTAGDYVAMLNTHSDHQLLPADRRKRLLDELATLIDTHYGGSVIKDYATVLQMARLRN